ncbi:NAD-dependent DNA ligase LigA, partial [bacterium]|nr:NAD-dependent DNA ligase LigA [bacterium]
MDNNIKIKKEIEELRKKIRKHDDYYYVLNNPEITDTEYDKLMYRLKELETSYPQYITSDSPTQRISEYPLKLFKTVKHRVPMLSLDNTYSAEEIKEWDKRTKKMLPDENIEYVVELKIDGIGVSLVYEDGVLFQGITRGNGEVGNDITLNVRTVNSIPLQLKGTSPGRLEVRGEIFM